MKRLALLLLFTLSCLYSIAQSEICNDGIDNDGDGFIDCYDPDCAASGNCSGTFLGNDVLCQAQPVEFPKFTMALDFSSPNETTNHLARMAIGDLDRDGIPEIITMNRYTKKVFVLDGRNGSVKHTLNAPFTPQWEIAIANIDNDNCAEIFTFGTESGDTYLYSYDCSLSTQLWKTKINGDPINFGLADFDGDGLVELYAKDEIYDAKTGTRIIKSNNWNSLNGGPVAVDILGDDKLELVVGLTIYSVNLGARTADSGSLTEVKKINNYTIKNSYNATSVADYNQDGFLDVIASGALVDNKGNKVTTVFFWDVQTDIVKTYSDPQPGISNDYKYGWKNGTGRINIADLDGDKNLNASFVSGRFLYALDENFGLLWKVVINEETSGYTGCTLFDFNGDGKSEIVYRDEQFIYIINGTDGSVFNQQACISRTNREYPIVADVDADGSTELCVPCGFSDADAKTYFDDLDYSQYSHIRVYKSASEPWVPARRLWNQHGYFNVNVNDNLTIPIKQQKHHLVFSTGSCTQGPNRPLNSFLNQSPFLDSQGCPTYASPDLAHVPNSLVVNPPTCPDLDFTVSFQITNIGDVSLDGVVPITFYSGDPTAAGAIKLNTIDVTLTGFAQSAIFDVSNATVSGPGSPFTLYIVLNDGGTTVPTPIKLPNTNFVECDYGNNIVSAPVNPLPVAITAVKVADNVKCVGSTTPDNGAVRAFIPVGATENTADYNFYWFNGSTVDATPDYVGSTYTGIANGTYTVFAKHKTASCNSDTVSVVVGQVNKTVAVTITLLTPVTDCKHPNGSLQAIVNGGSEPATNFTYAWYEGNDIFTSPQVGVSATATDLKALTYTVLVTDKISGCQSVESFTVPDNSNAPVVSTTKTDILCSTGNSGSASANVGGGTGGFTFKWYNGSNVKPSPDFTGSTYSNLVGGNYTVVAIRNSTNCTSAPVTVTIIQTTVPTLTATVTANQTSCDPTQPNGSVSASALGGSGDYSFEWFKGQNTAPFNLIASANVATGLDIGKYTSKVTDNVTGCSAQAVVTVTLNIGPTPVISATVVDQTQCTPFNGSITASVSTGVVGDYIFSWYNGSSVKPAPDFTETSNVLSNIPAGTYTVKAIHSTNFCQASPKTFTVQDLSPSITMTLNGSVLVFPSDCSSADGVMGVTVNAPGNTLGFTMEWFYGRAPFSAPSIATQTVASTSTVSNLIAGVYTIIATDLNTGCQKTQEFNLPFAEAHSLDFISKTDITKCVPNDDGDVTVKLNPSPLVAGAFDEGDYDIYVYAGSNDPGPTGTPVVPVISGIAAQSNYTTPSTLTAQFYTFVAVSTKPGQFFGCRSIPLLVEIVNNTVNPVIGATSITANTNCIGIAGNGQITASADGGDPLDYTFEWFNGTNESAPVLGTTGGVNGEQAINLAAGFYTVRITNNQPTSTGCQSVAVFSVPSNPMPVDIAAGGLTTQDLMSCNPGTGNVINNGSATVANISPGVPTDYNYVWTDATSAVLQSGASATINNIGAGTFFVRATNAANCFTELEFVINDQTIGSTMVNLIDFGSPERCVMPIDGFLTVNDDPSYTYEWYAGATPSGPIVNGTNDLQGITIPPGMNNTTFTVKAIGANGCWGVDTYDLPLQVNEVIITASSSSPITNCVVDNGIVFGTVVNDNSLDYTYDWYIGMTVNATSDFTGKQVSNLGVGSYTVRATDMVDAFCQSLPKTVILEDQRVIPPVAAAEGSPLTNCDPLKANGSAAASVTGNIVNYTFDWYAGTTATGTPFFSGPVADGLLDGTYTVTATDKITGCTGTTQVVITKDPTAVPNPDIVVISNVTSCIMPNGELSVSVGGNTKDYLFDWYNGTAVKASVDYTGEIISGLDVGSYTVTATSRITGCTSGPVTEDIINSQVFPDFEFKIVPSSCDMNNGSATLYLVNEVNVESIVWNANGGMVIGPNLYDVMAGAYDVTVTTIEGCQTNVGIMIGTEIRPYNGVSRNDDGKNDIFYIDCIDHFPGNNVRIFNRAGTLVYESNGYDNSDIFFDGKSNKGLSPMGVNLPDGTYYYIIDKRDGSKPLAGYVELVK